MAKKQSERQTEQDERLEIGFNRRQVLKSAAAAGVLIGFGASSTVTAAATEACTDKIVDLIAGQDEVIGSVTVTNDDDEITVTYSLAGDWYMTESHLHFAMDCDDIPQTGSGNPQVGRFEFSRNYDPATQNDTYVASLDAQGFEEEDLICIAAHAAVFEDEDDDGVFDSGEREETAWGDGARFTERGNWATHFEYEICAACSPCSFDTSATGSGASNLLSVGPASLSGFPAIDARLRVDSPEGNAGNLEASNFAVCEDGCGQTLESVAFEPGGSLDLVVVFDDTGSMGDEIAEMKSEVNSLTSDIEAAGIDTRYALVSFKDSVEIDTDFADASTFQTAVSGLSASGGGDLPEDNLDALAVGTGNAPTEGGASLSAFRPGAQRVVIDITDAPAHDETDSRTRFSQSEIETFLNDGNFTYYAVSPPASATGPVSKQTIANNVDDGTWIDIRSASDLGTILNDIVAAITEPAYVLSYTTTNPATDGTTRTVNIEIDDPDEGLLYLGGTYTAPN